MLFIIREIISRCTADLCSLNFFNHRLFIPRLRQHGAIQMCIGLLLLYYYYLLTRGIANFVMNDHGAIYRGSQ